MLFDFHNYLYNIRNNDVYSYFNAYSTALLTRSDLKDNVLKHRMNFLIDYYTTDVIKNNNISKNNYINYYLKNFKDDFKSSLLNSHENKNNNKEIDITEDFDKDVRDHYIFLTSKPPTEPEVNYDELDEKFYREEEEKKLEKELEKESNYYEEDDDYYYDEYYEDEYFDDDYYNLNRDDY